MKFLRRGKFAFQIALRHLGLSFLVAVIAAGLVFLFWYPPPTSILLNVAGIYILMLVVDVVCGPLLTLVIATPRKSRRELAQDLGLVILIQLAALIFGLYTLYMARPVAFVFEQDRVVVVTRNELLDSAHSSTFLPAWGVQWYIADLKVEGDGRLDSLDLSLQGITPAMRPHLWKNWDWTNSKLQLALHSLSALSSEQRNRVDLLRGAAYLKRSDLVYLPLVTSKNLEWIMVFDQQGRWLDSLPLDGFIPP